MARKAKLVAAREHRLSEAMFALPLGLPADPAASIQEKRVKFGEERLRWTDGFDGDEIGVFRKTERDCPSCGFGSDVDVIRGWRRGLDVHRLLRCRPCGRRWWQISIGER